MRSWMNGFSLGIICVSFFTQLSVHFLWAVLLLAVLLFAWLRYTSSTNPAFTNSLKYSLLATAIACCFGIIWAGYYGLSRLAHQLPAALEQQDIWVTGQVVGLPRQTETGASAFGRNQYRQRFILSPTVLSLGSRTSSSSADPLITHPLGPIQLSWYHPATDEHAITRIEPDDTWRLKVRLKRPRGLANPGGFDYQSWLFAEGIAATGYVRADPGNRRIQMQDRGFSPQRWRADWLADLERDLAGYPQAGLIIALVSGERDGINPDQWRLFTHTGTNHLMTISGLHIGLTAGLCYGLGLLFGKLLLWLLPRALPARFNAHDLAILAGIAAALMYSFLAGFSLPTQRALIMLAVLFLGQWLGLAISWWSRFSLALAAVLAWNPLAPLGAGFWLSFGAVAGLIIGFSGYAGALPWHWRLLRTQWVVALMLLPILVWQFNGVSLVGPLANMVAVPLASLLLIPGCLLSVLLLTLDVPGAHWLLDWVDQGLGALLVMLAWFADPEHAYLDLNAAMPSLVLAAIGVAVLLLPKGISGRGLGWLLLVPLLFPPTPDRAGWPSGQFEFTMLDVGQGLAAVVQTQNHVLVYDTGPRFSERFNMADAVVLPYLQHNGIARVDRIIVSHGDNDHAGSLLALLNGLPYGDLVSGASQLPPVSSSPCQDGHSWRWDGVTFTTYRLPPALQQSENDRSCLLSVSNGRYSVLLPGDISRRGEQALLARHDLRADILVAPHHGSKSSSSSAFIAVVDPSYVIYTAGYLNRYHHPHSTVVRRYENAGVSQVNTALAGAVAFSVPIAGPLPAPQIFRRQHQRYWLDAPAQLY